MLVENLKSHIYYNYIHMVGGNIHSHGDLGVLPAPIAHRSSSSLRRQYACLLYQSDAFQIFHPLSNRRETQSEADGNFIFGKLI